MINLPECNLEITGKDNLGIGIKLVINGNVCQVAQSITSWNANSILTALNACLHAAIDNFEALSEPLETKH